MLGPMSGPKKCRATRLIFARTPARHMPFPSCDCAVCLLGIARPITPVSPDADETESRDRNVADRGSGHGPARQSPSRSLLRLCASLSVVGGGCFLSPFVTHYPAGLTPSPVTRPCTHSPGINHPRNRLHFRQFRCLCHIRSIPRLDIVFTSLDIVFTFP